MNGRGRHSSGGQWGAYAVSGPWPPGPEAMRGVCFCLLYDLCCWLAGVERGVPDDVDEYTLAGLRQVELPFERLSRYVSPDLMKSWEGALQPFFASGYLLDPELGEAGSFRDHGRDRNGRVKAELTFGNRSGVLDRGERRHELTPRDWVLTVWLSPEPGKYVENATIRLA